MIEIVISCLQHGVLSLERLSIRHMQAVSRCSGAKILASKRPHAMWPKTYGSVKLGVKQYGGRTFLQMTSGTVSSETRAPVSTVILGAQNEFAMQELSEVGKHCYMRTLARCRPNAIARVIDRSLLTGCSKCGESFEESDVSPVRATWRRMYRMDSECICGEESR